MHLFKISLLFFFIILINIMYCINTLIESRDLIKMNNISVLLK